MNHNPQVTLSIVSHGQAEIVRHLLGDCRNFTGSPL
jgi:hypothetical protein